MTTSPSHLILGGGITGLTLALKLQERTKEAVLLVEKEDYVGGLAAGPQGNGRILDPGSHRIHPDINPDLLAFLESLPGVDFIKRPRHGKLHLGGRWLNYPPAALDLLTTFSPLETAGFIRDFIVARCQSLFTQRMGTDFESLCLQRMGHSLYQRFYRPYARRLFAHEPRFLDGAPASGRLRSFSPRNLWQEMVQPGEKKYLYPRTGFSSIARGLEQKFLQAGGRLLRNSQVAACSRNEKGEINQVVILTADGTETAAIRTVTATIPAPEITDWLFDCESSERNFDWRDLRIMHLLVNRMVPEDTETFYFPEPVMLAGRISRIDRYSPELAETDGQILLTCEIPCTAGDTLAELPARQLARTLRRDLQRLSLSPGASGEDYIADRRLHRVYPLHTLGWRKRLNRWLDCCASVPNFATVGRSGLFLHCNLDHCLRMAMARADSIIAGEKADSWRKRLEEFLDYRIRE